MFNFHTCCTVCQICLLCSKKNWTDEIICRIISLDFYVQTYAETEIGFALQGPKTTYFGQQCIRWPPLVNREEFQSKMAPTDKFPSGWLIAESRNREEQELVYLPLQWARSQKVTVRSNLSDKKRKINVCVRILRQNSRMKTTQNVSFEFFWQFQPIFFSF